VINAEDAGGITAITDIWQKRRYHRRPYADGGSHASKTVMLRSQQGQNSDDNDRSNACCFSC